MKKLPVRSCLPVALLYEKAGQWTSNAMALVCEIPVASGPTLPGSSQVCCPLLDLRGPIRRMNMSLNENAYSDRAKALPSHLKQVLHIVSSPAPGSGTSSSNILWS